MNEFYEFHNTMNDTILDDNFAGKNSELSDFQLIGILNERKKFHVNIIEKVETEFISRKIDTDIIADLEGKYTAFHAPVNEKIAWRNFIQTPLIILIIIYLISPVQLSILLISIYIIKLKIEQGEQAGKKYWNYFAIFYLILFPILILVGILIS